jgi:S1-C subfamily serine protease
MNSKLIALSLLFAVTACSSTRDFRSYARTTVSITNMAGNSGGSGTVVFTSATESKILTNAHVCAVAEHGGTVNTEDGDRIYIKSWKVSQKHDLCLITVAKDLKHSAPLAAEAPSKLDESVVSGHPVLLPVIVNFGHFSEHRNIQVMTGYRGCTDAEKADPNTGFFCALIGKLPVLKTYDAQIVSNLIQPGSSGSGVYNTRGELSGVVFAGSGDIGYGMIVPYEYVAEFLLNEAKVMEEHTLSTDAAPSADQESKRDLDEKMVSACKTNKKNPLCAALDGTIHQ